MAVHATTEGVRGEHVVAPLTGDIGEVAALSFDNGLERVDLRADAGLDALLEAWFAEVLPVVRASGPQVHVDYPRGSRLLRRMGPNRVHINPALAWTLEVHGGAAHLDADLTGVRIDSLSVDSGAAYCRIALGRPQGQRALRLRSVKDLRIERPAGVPVRIELSGGAANITFDKAQFGAVGGVLTQQTEGYDDAGDRYLVTVDGGADTLVVTQGVPR